jgi:hypothetical protein
MNCFKMYLLCKSKQFEFYGIQLKFYYEIYPLLSTSLLCKCLSFKNDLFPYIYTVCFLRFIDLHIMKL